MSVKKCPNGKSVINLRTLLPENVILMYMLCEQGDTLYRTAHTELQRRGFLDATGNWWTEKLSTHPASLEDPADGNTVREELRDHLLLWDGREALNDVLDIDTKNIAPKVRGVARG